MTDQMEHLVWATNDLPEDRLLTLKSELASSIARDSSQRRHVRIGAGVGAVGATALVTVAASLLSGPAAGAVWSAVPAPLTISMSDPMVQACLADLPVGTHDETGHGPLMPLVAERRGRSRAALLGGDDSQAICIATPTSRTGGRTVSPELAPGQDISVAGNGGSTDAASGDRYVYGRVSSGVTAVSITTTAGVDVTASVVHGSYVAWWPGPAGPATIAAKDSRGQMVAEAKP
jgi:hypothetical protein